MMVIVSDVEAGECVDPEGNGVNPGEGMGGPAHLVRSKITSWSAIVEETRLPWGNQEDRKTSPTWHQGPIMHRVCSIVDVDDHYLYVNSNSALYNYIQASHHRLFVSGE
jgi:hypothetical protein